MYPAATTDETGRYCIAHVEVGEYVMSVKDEEKGYPMMGSLFFALPPARRSASLPQNPAACAT